MKKYIIIMLCMVYSLCIAETNILDHTEKWWKLKYNGVCTPSLYTSHLDPDGDGWGNWPEARYAASKRGIADPNDASTYPIPIMIFVFKYFGSKKQGPIVVHLYDKDSMNGVSAVYKIEGNKFPLPLTITTTNVFSGHAIQGQTWALAFIDNNNNGAWDEFEPMGLATRFPYTIGWDKNEIEFVLTDRPVNGFVRFSWPPAAATLSYTASIWRDVMGQNGTNQHTMVYQKVIGAPRTWLHEGDILDVNAFGGGAANRAGLDWGGVINDPLPRPIDVNSRYRYVVTDNSGHIHTNGFTINYYNGVLPASTPIEPINGALQIRPRPVFKWRMPIQATAFELEILKGDSGNSVAYSSGILPAPPPAEKIDGNPLGTLRVWSPPVHWGDNINGIVDLSGNVFRWRVYARQSRDPTLSRSPASASGLLQVALGTDNGLGRIKVPLNANYLPPGLHDIKVQAFTTASFNDVPVAQKTLISVATLPQTVNLDGLTVGTPYYIAAYIDQNFNNRRDIWESWGYFHSLVMSPTSFYFQPLAIYPNTLLQAPNDYVTIRYVDSDNDGTPDSYEYFMEGDLNAILVWDGNLLLNEPEP